MLGAPTFFLRQLHEWHAIPAGGSPASRCATPQLGEGDDGSNTRMGVGRAQDHRIHHLGRRTFGKTASAGDNTNLDQCRPEIQRDVRLMAQRAGTANLPLQGGQVPLMARLGTVIRRRAVRFRDIGTNGILGRLRALTRFRAPQRSIILR
jgi:hypothetical protein